jgi:hypothetical protein
VKRRETPLDWLFPDEQEWDEERLQRRDRSSGDLDSALSQARRQRWWWMLAAALCTLVAAQLALHRTPAVEPPPQPQTATGVAAAVRSIETAFFRIYYREQDAQVVAAVATGLDALYAQLHSDFGLAPPSPKDKVWVFVPDALAHHYAPLLLENNVSNTVEMSRHVETAHDPVLVPVTALSPTTTASPSSVLTRHLANALALRTLAEAQRQRTIRPGWQTMSDGLHYYFWANQLGEQVLPEVVALALHWRPRPPLPAYRITGAAPPHALSANDWLEIILAAGLVDYLVQTYGRERLDVLLDGFSRYYSWVLLSRTVFGVEASELEAGWRAWLDAQNQTRDSHLSK